MKILIVLAHPELKSMNGAMFERAIAVLTTAGHEVQVSDLYRAQFNPVSDRNNFTTTYDAAFFKQQLEEMHAVESAGFAADIAQEQQKVEWCDLMIWQFPLWWFTVPGVLKGWVDRVFAMGRFYGNSRCYETGMLQGKKALLSLTTGGSEESYLKDGLHGDLAGILKPVHRGMLEFVGFSVLAPQVVYAPVRQSVEERETLLVDWGTRLEGIFEEQPIVVGGY
ncbi:NAD(P)H-dependent oxidoreductase [Chitinophaga pinensis]|uniref:Ribosyldihydronicotinamide dehydrogenase (Quinone) n=1 Tax=Chitinophaga pinensis (strain ATCC 43595 / DSM 2588 / LMG 13176 / NBRC 15968 / NCIMB 11800 / UQM 2034) TaxID=485918 RepID=A0A979GXA9_CHIPD|nr:NAD(P)H-dependent oxidoreductase [Chitinophaga pinensis]ACU62419.1 Ribosyldihydronicotinamide dehydrogenase (quinone) [Chitinophaga pinensis DSM 2588]